MKFYPTLALTGLVLFTSLNASAIRDCKTSRTRSVVQQLANLDSKIDLKLLDLDIFPGGSIATGYEYEVEPAFTNGMYFRKDSWQLSTKAIPEDKINISEGFDFSIAGGFRHKAEATFISIHNDPCKAMFAKAYSPRKIPLTVRSATKDKFKIGDYFLFRSAAAFVVSGELLNLLGSAWGVSAGASYMVEGYYQLHIVRLDDSHIRLKIIAHRGNEISANIGVGFTSDFEVFKVGFLDKGIMKFIEEKPIKIEFKKGHDQVMLIDYVLDLSDDQVGTAYEKLLRKVKDFKGLALTTPFKSDKDIEANLLLDLTGLEDLYKYDYNNNSLGRIKRNLRTTSGQESETFGFNLGNRLLGIKKHDSVSTALMSVRRPDDVLDRYLFRSWEMNSSSRVFYSWYRASTQSGLNALFTADKNSQIVAPVNMVKHYRRKSSRLSYDGLKKIKTFLNKSLPIEVYNQIPWSDWAQTPTDKYTNFGMRFQMVLSPEVILEAPELSKEEITVLFKDYLKQKSLVPSDYFSNSAKAGPHKGGAHQSDSAEGKMNSKIKSMAKDLEKALNRKLLFLDRLNAITKLRKNKVFSESGFSFIMALRPDKLNEWFHLDLNLSSNEAQVDFDFGDGEISILYKKLLTIKAALDDESLDLLREAESLSTPSSPVKTEETEETLLKEILT